MTGRAAALGGLWLVGIAIAYLLGNASSRPVPPISDPESALAPSAIRGAAITSPRASFERQLPEFEDPRTHDQLLDIADRWGADAPQEAVEWLAKLEFDDPRNPFLFAALTHWTTRDPDAAISWLDANGGSGRDYLLAAVIRGLARTDPDRALQLLLDAPSSPERSGALDFVVGAWQQVGAEHAFEEIEQLPASDPKLRLRAIVKAIDHLQELDAAKAWADSLTEPAEMQAAHGAIAANWARSDPPAAAEWALGLTDPPTRARALAEVATRWARIDPLASDRWLEAQGAASDFDLARRLYAGNTVSYDPATAFGHLADISSQRLRDESFEQIGRIFVSQRPAQARAYLAADTPFPVAIREQLLDLYAE